MPASRALILTLALGTLLLGACGDERADSPSSSTAPTTTAATTPTVDIASLAPMPGGQLECVQMAQELQSLSMNAAMVASSDGPDALASYRDHLPDVLRPDLDVVLDKLTALTRSAEGDTLRGADLADAELVAATDRLNGYLSSACNG